MYQICLPRFVRDPHLQRIIVNLYGAPIFPLRIINYLMNSIISKSMNHICFTTYWEKGCFFNLREDKFFLIFKYSNNQDTFSNSENYFLNCKLSICFMHIIQLDIMLKREECNSIHVNKILIIFPFLGCMNITLKFDKLSSIILLWNKKL